MPSTVGGLLLFVIFLVPGLIGYLVRRRSIPQRTLSPLVEVATLVTVSVVTNLCALGLFIAVRGLLPSHTPNLEELIKQTRSYFNPRAGYILVWGLGLLITSSVLAVGLTTASVKLRTFKWLSPVLVDQSAWYQLFDDEVPPETRIFVGCDMRDGTYVSGYLDWFNTDIDEVADRDLILATPITVRSNGVATQSEFQRLIISAREIVRMHVTYMEMDEN